MPFTIPTVNIPRVPNHVTETQIIEAFNAAFDMELVERVDRHAGTDHNSGASFWFMFVHFRELDSDPENEDLTEFIRLTNNSKIAMFYYGTRIDTKTGNPFYFKTRLYKPRVSEKKESVKTPVKTGMLSSSDMSSQLKRSKSKPKATPSKASASDSDSDSDTESNGD